MSLWPSSTDCEFCGEVGGCMIDESTFLCSICYRGLRDQYLKEKKKNGNKSERVSSDRQSPIDAVRLQQPLSEEERFQQLAAKSGEHFDDFFVVVRYKGGIMYRFSDQNWMLGALNRCLTEVQLRDNYNLLNDMREGK